MLRIGVNGFTLDSRLGIFRTLKPIQGYLKTLLGPKLIMIEDGDQGEEAVRKPHEAMTLFLVWSSH